MMDNMPDIMVGNIHLNMLGNLLGKTLCNIQGNKLGKHDWLYAE